MEEKKRYSRDVVPEIVCALVRVARNRKNYMDVPRDFIKEHPWTARYLANYADSDDFFRIVRQQGLSIEEVKINEEVARMRAQQGLGLQICFLVSVPKEAPVSKRYQYFLFEDQGDGTFLPLEPKT